MDTNQRISAQMSTVEENAEQRAVSGIFTTLGLILLTLMVYLMSLSEPDKERQTNVYMSLAKAFLFAEQTKPEPVAADNPQLLSSAKLTLRDLAAYLDRSGLNDATAWVDGDLMVSLPGAKADDVPRALLIYLARMGAAMGVAVNVEAYAAPEQAANGELHVPLAQAVMVAQGMTAEDTGLNPAQVQAAGYPTPLKLEDGLEAESMRMRVVFVDAEATL